jgi:3-deoxy-manno-octulosonate cytidylyltransferase (CMP-KDO synthetase)
MNDDGADMATAGTPIRSERLLNDPSCVKIVMAWETEAKSGAGKGRAVYFSRATVPFVRDGVRQCHFDTEPPLFWHHIGLYAYRRDFLEWFAEAPPGALEQAEKLEQLRAIEAGKRIVVERVESATPGIDTQADLDAFTMRLVETPRT